MIHRQARWKAYRNSIASAEGYEGHSHVAVCIHKIGNQQPEGSCIVID